MAFLGQPLDILDIPAMIGPLLIMAGVIVPSVFSKVMSR
jgi:hypothetical protein